MPARTFELESRRRELGARIPNENLPIKNWRLQQRYMVMISDTFNYFMYLPNCLCRKNNLGQVPLVLHLTVYRVKIIKKKTEYIRE